MVNAVLWDNINQDVNDAEIQANIQRNVLIKRDPFELSDEKFVKMFRLSKELVRNIVEMITQFVEGSTRASALTRETKVSVWFCT